MNSSGDVNPNAHVLMKGVMEETNYGRLLSVGVQDTMKDVGVDRMCT